MLIYFSANRRVCLWVCVLFLVFAGAVVAHSLTAEGQDEVTLSLSVEDGAVYICASMPLHAISGGRAVALRMDVEGSKGWSFGEVTVCEGAEGMVVTAGLYEDRLRILLDGVPPTVDPCEEGGSIQLLRISVCPEGGTEDPVRMALSLPDGVIYSMGEGDDVCTLPVLVESRDDITSDIFSDDIEIPTEPPQETTGKSDDMVPETHPQGTKPPVSAAEPSTETMQAGETATDTAAAEGLELPVSRYVGCQETPVKDGLYAVRFLFYGETPVVCIRGGGYLQMEITHPRTVEVFRDGRAEAYDGDWSVCTIRGLRREGIYLFRVYTEGECVDILYRNGQFVP